MSDKGKEKEKVLYSGSPKGLNLAPELFTESYESEAKATLTPSGSE